jgi:hypothetical protein
MKRKQHSLAFRKKSGVSGQRKHMNFVLWKPELSPLQVAIIVTL